IPVHLYGNPCDMDTLQKIAEDNQIYIVEDATESLGSKYNGKYTGAFGDMGCFSFNGNKLMTTGGGGMVVSSDQKKNEYLRSLVNQGREQGKQEEITHIGFNNKMTNIEAALGLAQMQQLNAFIGKKKSFNRIYRERLDGLSGIQFQGVFPNADPCYWLTAIMCDESIQVSEVQKILAEKKIQTRRVFMPITSFVPYACFHREPYHNAQYIYEHGICLPSSMVNNDDDIQYVCNVLEEIISHEDNDLCKKE
ncbi:MAG: DegT/DnrJ/EryC1/StrS family aminotransferase, partial [Candidatus Heimdallarchaeota archaeon]|nr:DegT/DnrJ/EryC1/StrS family aminotransferase [Candidatus Heimdallarchaeota archaeon]